MLNFEQLLTNIKQCELCKSQLPLSPRPIFQCSSKSKVLVAGQAPGAITHDKGRPFDDKSGERLRAWLGVDINTFYRSEAIAIVPMGFCYPGKGSSGDLPPIPLCAETWRKPLLNRLKDIQLTVLIGKYAIDWHLSHHSVNWHYKNITEMVKRYEELLSHNLIALPHPSPRNNLWLKKNPWFEQKVVPILHHHVSIALERNK